MIGASLAVALELSPIQWQLIGTQLRITDEQAELSDEACRAVIVLATVRKIRWLSGDQQQWLMQALLPSLESCPPEFCLAFVDGFKVTWTGYQGLLDLRTGVAATYCPPFESIAYNPEAKRLQLARCHKPGDQDADCITENNLDG